MSSFLQDGWMTKGMTALAFLVLTGAGAPLQAQSKLDFELRGAVDIPAGDLDEVGETGGGFGAGLSYRIHDRAALRLDGELEILSEDLVGKVVMPRTFLWHYHAGLEVDVTDPDTSPWIIRARGGAGGTTYDTQRFYAGGDDFFDVYFSVSGGLSVGRHFRSNMEIGALGQVFIVYTDKARTAELAQRSPGLLNPFDAASSFPVGLYLRWRP